MTDVNTTNAGGFDIDGKTYVFDVVEKNAAGVDPVTTNKKSVSNQEKDLSKKTRLTLGQYLSDVTSGKHADIPGTANSFPIDRTDSLVEVKLIDDKGLPTKQAKSSNSRAYAKDVENIDGTTIDSPELRSTKIKLDDPRTTLSLSSFGKGKQGKKYDGNNLLINVESDSIPEPVETYRSTVLNTNRFTAENKFSDEKDFIIKGKTYKVNQLQQVGAVLSLRSSQEIPASTAENINPASAGTVAGALIPSPNQLGVLKIPNAILQAQDALESLSNNNDSLTVVEIAPLGNQSWGALNNVEDQWTGTLNVGMVALALALQSAMLLAFEGLGALVGVVSNGSPPSTARNVNGTYVKGSYLSSQNSTPGLEFPPNIRQLLGINGTKFPFEEALKIGVAAFFVGAQNAKNGLGSQLVSVLTSAATNVLSDSAATGQIVIVSRTIIRSAQSFATQIDKISSAFSSNAISGVKSVVGLLEVLKSSKLIAAINVFTMLGDAILSEGTYARDTSSPAETGMFSNVDAIDPNSPGAAAKKSRLVSGESATKLAWASNRAPAAYLVPDSILAMTFADTKLGSFKGPLAAQDPDGRGYLVIQSEAERKQNGARIPHQSLDPNGIDVKKIEQILDAEYVPFYFHDLRTNEIISFHAFLSALTDDFSPAWESSEGFGRVDPIKIYKNTTRKISISFHAVALDRKDFDEMWMKINKLITLVYPQYTKGRTLTDGNGNSFVQPFSQMIGASPLIRLRLGDLLKSNYSRFALARLFGAADGDMKLDGDIKFEGSLDLFKDSQMSKYVSDLIKNAKSDKSLDYMLSSAGWAGAFEQPGLGISFSVSGPSSPDQAPTMKIDEGDMSYFRFKISKVMNNGMFSVIPSIATSDELLSSGFTDAAMISTVLNSLNSKYNNKDNPTTKVIGGKYAVPEHALKLTEKSLKKILSKTTIGSSIENIEKLSTFLDVEKNAIVKSFRSVQGKGLAGVIENLNFDWYDKVTWETELGSTAPKMCKISISFSPIHDISPGIDHLGYNRAPIYAVGNAMGHGRDDK